MRLGLSLVFRPVRFLSLGLFFPLWRSGRKKRRR